MKFDKDDFIDFCIDEMTNTQLARVLLKVRRKVGLERVAKILSSVNSTKLYNRVKNVENLDE